MYQILLQMFRIYDNSLGQYMSPHVSIYQKFYFSLAHAFPCVGVVNPCLDTSMHTIVIDYNACLLTANSS